MLSKSTLFGKQFAILSLFLWPVESACPLCGNGLESTSLPNTPLQLPDFPSVATCRDLQPILQETDDEVLCRSLQVHVGGLCECPPLHDTANGCELCDESQSFAEPQRELPALQNVFGFTPTCSSLQTYLRFNKTDCKTVREFHGVNCLCTPTPAMNMSGIAEIVVRDGSCNNLTTSNTKGEITLHPFFSHLLPANTMVRTCGDLDAQQNLLDDLSAEECRLLESYCGEIEVQSPETCQLCLGGGKVGSPNRTLPFLESWFNFVPTCGFLEAWIFHNPLICIKSQNVLGAYCMCESKPNSTGPFSESNPEMKTEEKCEFCTSNTLKFPDRELPDLQEFYGFVPTCALVDVFLSQQDKQSDECAFGRVKAVECGCQPTNPELPPSCDICPFQEYDLESVRNQGIMPFLMADGVAQEEVNNQARLGNFTCGKLHDLSLLEPAQDTESCKVFILLNNQCGCPNGVFFLAGGMWTPCQNRIAAWIPRISAILSILFSGLVMLDILLKKKKKSYQQIVLGIATFDFANALGWALSSLPVPPDFRGFPLGWHGARGNATTCILQGILIQLGMTSVFFSVALTVYYKLAIVDGWKESRIKSFRWLFCGVPLLLGISLALGGIPLYEPLLYSCHFMANFPVEWKPMFFFAIAPLVLSILASAGLLIHVYLYVRRTYAASNKWSISLTLDRLKRRPDQTSKSDENNGGHGLQLNSHSRNPRLVKEVYGQMIAYILAFFITWPILVGFFFRRDLFDFPSASVALFMIPLQGFSDSLVYFRPRIKRWVTAAWMRGWHSESPPMPMEEPMATMRMEPSVALVADRQPHLAPPVRTVESMNNKSS